jgi:ABC-2 type transport system ATP-binding protein
MSSPVETDEVIRCEDLTKIYPGDVKAVDTLNLSVHRGEIFGLLGPNGAGKTTTAGMLTTRVIPTSGKAIVDGIDVVAHPALAKQVIGVVAQSNTLDRSLSVWENLYFHGRFFGQSAREARAAADQLLVTFRLSERAKAPVMALSGGMAQRLMVARAIEHRPAILFLDEPTAGLDPQSRIAMWEILGELHSEGQTILLTTHYMEEADQLSDRIGIIDQGRIIALGTPAELKQRIAQKDALHFEVAGYQPQMDAALQELPGVDRLATRYMGADSVWEINLQADNGRAVLPGLIEALGRGGARIVNMKVSEPSLEDVFIHLTGKALRD